MSAAAALREVRLYGVLGRKFGRVHRLAVASAREAVHALCVVLPGFGQHLATHSEPGYHVFIGKRGQGNLGPDRLDQPVSAREPICLVPVVAGGKSGGLFQVILGVALIGLAMWNPLGFVVGEFAPLGGVAIGKIGAYLALGGVVQMIAAHQMGKPQAGAAGEPSYRFDSQVNVAQEGGPVPLRYGRTIYRPNVVSQGILSEDIKPAAAPAPMPPATLPAEQPLDPIAAGGNFES